MYATSFENLVRNNFIFVLLKLHMYPEKLGVHLYILKKNHIYEYKFIFKNISINLNLADAN